MSQTHLKDAVGVHHPVAEEPPRIVCLVPSITELLFALNLGDFVVGRTHYCIHPAQGVAPVPSVGGTKKIKHGLVRELRATHAIVNIDENTRPMAERLAEYVPHVIVTHPLAPEDNPGLYRLLGEIFGRQAEAEALCRDFNQVLDELRDEARSWPRRRVLYLIWRNPWMTVARDTYLSRTLALVGWDTLPDQTEQRYPVISIDKPLLEDSELVLFSTEPYRFTVADVEDFARQYAYPRTRTVLIDGEMTSWYGNRAIQGLRYLRRVAADLANGG
ncbi:MAG: ABC transporter substrate-binding protein [Gammaproteobacteria bacterium]|nr:ABC transporter substrate-binding protein [Gammaproteobacteria bacterium]MCP5424791.1 ABC transporter substrate-binding protein [Gammaproteobacteria bacterium]MCP5458232.1 ABC transporter substrate-binding protein [Gammaproteobacteria bacterium]